MIDALSALLIAVGAFFFAAGSIGVLRLPDLFSRLHALTKADNLGLGFVVLGLAFQAPGLLAAAKLILVWLVAMLSATTIGQLIASHGRRRHALARGSRRADGEDWE